MSQPANPAITAAAPGLRQVVSDYVGAVTITASKDDAKAHVTNSDLAVGALDAAARTDTSYTAIAKSVENDVTA